MMKLRTQLHTLLLTVVLAVGGGVSASAATLALERVKGNPGDANLEVPVLLTSGVDESVSALQFEFVHNADAFAVAAVLAGPTSEAAGKAVTANTVAPGRTRVVVAGFNQTAIGNGELAYVMFSVSMNAPARTYAVAIEHVVLSGPDGNPVPTDAGDGVLTIGNVKPHDADTNEDWAITLPELVRIIQFFNSNRYHCDPESEDGYGPGFGLDTCAPHNSDYDPPDWRISLTELLRLIQILNLEMYSAAIGTEDGYVPGPPSLKRMSK